MTKLKIKLLNENAKMPERSHLGDMYDIYVSEDILLNSFESKIVKLGLAFDIPLGYRIKLFSRSSLALNKKIVLSNSVGIIDTGYKNEIGFIGHTLPNVDENGNLKNNPVKLIKGDKIAQIQLEKIEDFELEIVDKLDLTNDRGGGFGSTGNK